MNKTKNPREVKKAIMAKEIVDLHGNIFKVIKGWEFYNKVPNLEGIIPGYLLGIGLPILNSFWL